MPTGHSSDGLHGFEIRAELPRGVGVDARLLDQLFGAMRQPLQELVPGLPSVIGGDDELRAVRLDRVRRGDLPDEIRKERRAQEDLEADGGDAARAARPYSATRSPARNSAYRSPDAKSNPVKEALNTSIFRSSLSASDTRTECITPRRPRRRMV